MGVPASSLPVEVLGRVGQWDQSKGTKISFSVSSGPGESNFLTAPSVRGRCLSLEVYSVLNCPQVSYFSGHCGGLIGLQTFDLIKGGFSRSSLPTFPPPPTPDDWQSKM